MCALTQAMHVLKQTTHSLPGNWTGVRKKSFQWYGPSDSPFAVDTDKDGQTTILGTNSFLWMLEIYKSTKSE